MRIPTRTRIGLAGVSAIVVMLSVRSTGVQAAASGSTATASGPSYITVGPKGQRLRKDGVLWSPHGVVMVAFECAPAAFANEAAYLQDANENYYSDPDEFTQIKTWGADTVRIMISQPGNDPQDPNGLYSAAYVSHIVAAVTAARSVGLNVIVNMQDETPSGDPSPKLMPDAATTRAWQNLAPKLNGDAGILYEIFNEPGLGTGASSWQTWQSDMNALIKTIRDTGSSNVILVDGLAYGNSFAGNFDGGAPLYPLTDSANSVAYAVHPYFHSDQTQTATYWASSFGNVPSEAALVVTEWYPGKAFFCDANTAQASLNLFDYLSANSIGITAFAWDFPDVSNLNITGSVNQDYAGATPTTFSGTTCDDIAYGPGTLLQSWYTTGMVPTHLE